MLLASSTPMTVRSSKSTQIIPTTYKASHGTHSMDTSPRKAVIAPFMFILSSTAVQATTNQPAAVLTVLPASTQTLPDTCLPSPAIARWTFIGAPTRAQPPPETVSLRCEGKAVTQAATWRAIPTTAHERTTTAAAVVAAVELLVHAVVALSAKASPLYVAVLAGVTRPWTHLIACQASERPPQLPMAPRICRLGLRRLLQPHLSLRALPLALQAPLLIQ